MSEPMQPLCIEDLRVRLSRVYVRVDVAAEGQEQILDPQQARQLRDWLIQALPDG